MKKMKLTLALLAALTAAGATMAAGTETTITGTAVCAKCALHESKQCETVVKATTDGKEVVYHLTGKEAKKFHHNICTSEAGEKVTVTGELTKKDGKEMLRATKIEEVK